jgi:hypothetical protein
VEVKAHGVFTEGTYMAALESLLTSGGGGEMTGSCKPLLSWL